MPTYLVLMKGRVSPEAGEELDIDEGVSDAESNRQIVEHLGGELRDLYYTSDPYDAALVIEYPDQETHIRARNLALQMGIDEIVTLDAVNHEDVEESPLA